MDAYEWGRGDTGGGAGGGGMRDLAKSIDYLLFFVSEWNS